jgi:hypothetical protein
MSPISFFVVARSPAAAGRRSDPIQHSGLAGRRQASAPDALNDMFVSPNADPAVSG